MTIYRPFFLNLRVSRTKNGNLKSQTGRDINPVTFGKFVTSLVQKLKILGFYKNCKSSYWLQVSFLPPAMKLQQGNVFTPVCHSVHRGVSVTPLGRHPPGQTSPLGWDPLWADTPWADTPTPWADTHPLGRHPLCTVHVGIWSTNRWYASYWNAFLLLNILSFWTNNVTNFPKVTLLMSLPICCFRFSIFVLETLKFEWQCNQYLQLNPTYVA